VLRPRSKQSALGWLHTYLCLCPYMLSGRSPVAQGLVHDAGQGQLRPQASTWTVPSCWPSTGLADNGGCAWWWS
jgi:hypothetical protein